ncbi:hypothetical protein F3J44_04100 [Pantoea sp. Tr-811]|nr:hypothetical protein [Pantoea sp. Tr-811]
MGCKATPPKQPRPCGSGLASRKGRAAAPDSQLRSELCRGRFAALSRHKAAPTKAQRVHA